MTVFPALFYTSAREISTLLYASSLKKILLSGGAFPYSPLKGVPPPSSLRMIPEAKAKRNTEGRGGRKLTVSRGDQSLSVLFYLQTKKYSKLCGHGENKLCA